MIPRLPSGGFKIVTASRVGWTLTIPRLSSGGFSSPSKNRPHRSDYFSARQRSDDCRPGALCLSAHRRIVSDGCHRQRPDAADPLYSLPPPKDGVLHLTPDMTRKEKTGKKQPLAYTTKMGKFEPYLFGHSVLLMIAHWGGFRIPVAVRVINPEIKGHQNILVREMLRKFRPPIWCQQVIVEADAEDDCGLTGVPTRRGAV